MLVRNASIKKIASFLNVSQEEAQAIKAVVTGKIDPRAFPKVAAWVNKCYNMPSRGELKMAAIDEIMKGLGTEAIFGSNDPYWPNISYVNTGDTYSPTVVRTDGKYYLSTWGDEFERLERKGILIP
jgi:hypothetical protein